MSKNWHRKQLPKLIVIVGPTASGKSDLAIKIAKSFHGEIVSADSRQIYRGMNIGTAKPELRASGKWRTADGITHHLVDIRDPGEEYAVANYKRDALRAIRGTLRRKKLPILVGGTGLYIKAVIENLDIPNVVADLKLRERLEARIKKYGLEALARKLLTLDPEAAHIVDLKNHRRVIRALEVALQTGRPFTAQRKVGKPLFDVLMIGIKIPPKILRERINRRVDKMIRAGLVEEVKKLLHKYGRAAALTNTIGYKEIIDCFADADNIKALQFPNTCDVQRLKTAVDQVKKNTWAYARRQMTWFRKNREIKWLTHPARARKLVNEWLKKR